MYIQLVQSYIPVVVRIELHGPLLFNTIMLSSFSQNEDIDECQRNMEICTTENAECINTDGGYTCNCSLGYEGDGELSCISKAPVLYSSIGICRYVHICNVCIDCYFICTDINECMRGTHDCDLNADCNDTVGSFLCTCHSGYEETGSVCTSKENKQYDRYPFTIKPYLHIENVLAYMPCGSIHAGA